MGLYATLRFIWNHPLASKQRARSIERYVRWQVGSRISPGAVVVELVDDARLVVRPGMTGATGNVYTGLHEFEDMAFVLHALRPEDVFVDVGANVGSYTILAAKAVGARCVSFEPIGAAFDALSDNVRLNGVEARVELHRAAVGATTGVVRMTTQLDTGNHIALGDDIGDATTEVPIVALDDLPSIAGAAIVKIDVEGFERAVLAGASRLWAAPTLLAVLMETNRASIAHGGREADAHDAMLAAGFAPYTYAPFERRLVSLGRAFKPDANTLYLRDPARVQKRLTDAPRYRVLGQAL